MTTVEGAVMAGVSRNRAIVRRRAGPPVGFEEPRVPHDLQALGRRREPLLDRLEKVRDSANLQLSEWSRDTLDEAIAILHRLGWDA